MAKTIFNMTDGILTPCNVARSWHWFRQVTASWNVAYCGSRNMTVNSPSGSKRTLQLETWLWDDMSLISPAMWHVALESWQWICPVAAAPCNVAGGSWITCYGIRPNVRHIGILQMVSISTTSPQSRCHSAHLSEILSKSDHPRQKKMTSCRFSRWRISAILDFRDPIMGSLKSPITYLPIGRQ